VGRAIELTINLSVDLRFWKSCYTRQLRAAALLSTCFCLLTCARGYALDPARSLDQFTYQNWQTGSGLPQNSAHAVLQTRDGFLWIATEGGLVRFDGSQFRTFDARGTPALGSNSIRALIEDPEGALWIATDAALCRRKGEQIESIQKTAGILALHQDHTGGLWAVMPDGLERWTSDPAKSPARFSLADNSPRFTGAIASDASGRLWLGTETGLAVWRNGTFENVTANLPQQPVESLLLDHSSRLWVGSEKGLYIAEPVAGRVFHPICRDANLASISALFEDFERSIWIGTGSGAYRITNPEQGCEKAANIGSGPVLSFAEDAEGDLWIGSESAGLSIVRNQKFVTYTSRSGLASDTVRCVFETRDGRLFFGGNDGLTEMRAGRTQRFTTADGLASNIVLSLGEDNSGDLLIGTPDGLDRLHNGAFSLTTSSDGLPDDFVRSLYTDSDGSLWIGTRRGLAHQDLSHRITTYTQANGLGSDLVGAVLRDRHGRLWAATLDGLSVLEDGHFQNFRTRDGLSSDVVTALYQDADGDLWIGTQDAGLNLRTRERFLRLPRTIGLPEAVYGIVEDANGELWIPSKSGIARVNRAELKAAAENGNRKINVVWYNTSDGLLVDECSIGGHPEVWKANDGTLWFSTLKGAAALSPRAARLNRILPPVSIESIQVDTQLLAPAAVRDLRPGTARLTFNYAALSFAAPQKIRYRYRLEGFDENWIDAGSDRSAYYTNIPPGEYSFRVIARNNDGFWNEAGALTTFRLEPRFYQTLWFYFVCALGLAAASYGIYRWRLLEIEARFQAVLQERNRIGREIHDTLAQSFVAVSMQLEIVSRLLNVSVEAAREHLDQARTQVREGLAEARRAIWQLRSESAGNEDLAARVSKTAQQAIGLNPVKLTMEVHGTYRPLRPEVEEELLRISQEAVNNSLRHAKPNKIAIELSYAAKQLRMTIADDGIGFTPGTVDTGPNGHFGLKGMRERAEQIHANLVVDSAAGRGTKVLVEAPLNS
jgi:ligand-binding sensor domain-containing protein/signal transduction histidine kinase